MKIRYQIFLSSTFRDLEDERRKVFNVLMKMNCIPAGMELFPAADDEQFEFIKKVIDNCDYYVLIVGGRYGSLSADGVSYTEKEYEYAVNKGVRVLSFLHKEPNKIEVGKAESKPELAEKLSHFREKVSGNRLVEYWSNSDELAAKVVLAVQNAISTYPAIGWVRANQVAGEDSAKQILEMKTTIESLQKQLGAIEKRGPDGVENLAHGNDKTVLKYRVDIRSQNQRKLGYSEWIDCDTTWDRFFGSLGPELFTRRFNQEVIQTASEIIKVIDEKQFLANCIGSANYEISLVELDMESYNLVMLQYRALGLISRTIVGNALFWQISKYGDNYLTNLLAIKRQI
jgi:hypothetical protein